MIQNIEISKIHPHYANPRKELGDLTELSDSIKRSGIFQNLTVVPWFSQITGVGCDDPSKQEEMGYIAVIGHRRLAAAKLAGLKEVPCAISNMCLRDQVATMLLENMQRSDLTIYEQAQGFQMMLDLGESLHDISEKTGFSDNTVRRRIKLLGFDQEKFCKSVERGGTLMDYAELEKINDPDLRNKVLDKIGTPNFKWELQNAIDKEKNIKKVEAIIKLVEPFATQIQDSVGMQYVRGYGDQKDITVPEDADSVEYFFLATSYGSVTLYKKYDLCQSTASADERKQEQERQKEIKVALDAVSRLAHQFRQDFVKSISNTTAKSSLGIAINGLLIALWSYSSDLDYEEYAKFLDIEIEKDEDGEYNFETISNVIKEHPEYHLLISTYLMLDSDNHHYYDWNNKYRESESLNLVYDFLEKFGYEISNEETALKNGTHKLFNQLKNEVGTW